MAKQTVTKEQIECSIDLMLMMIVEELQETLSMSAPEILESFLLSKTGQSLYDPDTKFWCFGPSYIVDLFLDEINLPSISEEKTPKALSEANPFFDNELS